MKHKHLFGVALGALLFSVPAWAQSTFPDVPDNHWAAAAVKKLAEAGIVEGFPNASTERASGENAAATTALSNTPRVKAALMNSPSMLGTFIDVDSWTPANATQSVVVLRGTVKNATQKKLAEKIAEESAPDARIVNDLKIVAPKTAKSKTSKAKAKPQKAVKRAA